MIRALVVAVALLAVLPRAAMCQDTSVLHITVVLIDGDGRATPVPRHALLISDNPPSASPRFTMTGRDGSVDVSLRPGNYTVESDRPIAFAGKAYQWTQDVDVVAGRGAVLELTADNAEIGPLGAASASDTSGDTDPQLLVARWQDSVVGLWTPTAHASGFVIDAAGLIATNQRVVGTASSVEVQLTTQVKIAATVLVSDAAKDVAVLWASQAAVASLPPVPLACAQEPKPAVVDGQDVFAIASPLRQQKDTISGVLSRIGANTLATDIRLATGGTGGPAFSAGGSVVGLTSLADESAGQRRGNTRIVRVDDICEVVASAREKMKTAAPPSAAHLPVEPVQAFPVDALKEAAQRRLGSMSPYQMASSDFDVAFITPPLIFGPQYQSEQIRRQRNGGARPSTPEPVLVRPLLDFANWSEYTADLPPVLLIRVTPKLVESLWTKVARGAAQTQGLSLPPIKRFTSGFLRMSAFCGDKEVTPIHPFKLERRVSETDAIYEGLYAFDPGALGPPCGSVKLVLYSEKAPDKGDAQVVDAKVVEQIWQDFAPYRDLPVKP